MEKYRLICIAPDGEYVIEGSFKTIDDAEKRSCDMGSRWYFYPYHCVVTGKSNKIVSIGFNYFNYYDINYLGRKLVTLKNAFKNGEISVEVC